MRSTLLAAALAASSVSAHTPTRRHHQSRRHLSRRDGTVTGLAYYGYQNNTPGSCGGAPHDDSELLAGLETSQYGPLDQVSDKCGKSIKVVNKATGASVTAVVTDSCSGCSQGGPGSLYLSVGAFSAIGNLDVGILDVTWSFVDGTTSTSPDTQGAVAASTSTSTGGDASGAQPKALNVAPAPSSDNTQQQNQQQGGDSPAPAPSDSPAPAPGPAPSPPSSNNPGTSVGNNGGTSADGWTQKSYWSGQAIFDNFDAEDKPCDNGASCYNKPYGSGLTWVEGNTAVMSVDGTPSTGSRGVVRLASKTSYNMEAGKLFIFDIAQLPSSCGQWPALWMVSRTGSWPENGEIDIIEAANLYNVNVQSVHTSAGCYLTGENMLNTLNPVSGADNRDCSAYSNVQNCGSTSSRYGSVGGQFNSGGGGVYALRWDGAGINMHFFPRGQVPGDIQAGNPTPSSWGQPDYQVPSGSCDPGAHFRDLSIMMTNTIGGVMSTGTWGNGFAGNAGASCQDVTGTDPFNFVANQGGQLQAGGFFKVNSVAVYSK